MSEPSPFRDLEAAAGAVFRSDRGIELPEQFGDPRAEYDAARTAAGLFDLSFRARVAATGPDRATFLHALTTNDVLALRPGTGCWSSLLTEQSKVVTDLRIFCREDDLLLDLDRRFVEAARAHLEKYLIADEVELEDRGDDAILGLQGPRAAEVLARLVADVPPLAAELDHATVSWNGRWLHVARADWTVGGGFVLACPREGGAELWQALRDAGEPVGLGLAGTIVLDVLRLEAGVPCPGIDFDDSHLALEASLEPSISFTKGCYLGQETVERVSSRGHVNRRRVGLRIDSDQPPARGTPLHKDGAEVGRLTSAAFSPALGSSIGFGYVKKEAMEPGTRLEIGVRAGGISSEVARLPFIPKH
ncbi:MAG: hypothetical protein QOD06_1008 [Candidatus Binatota bacterium]|nr:hypothetical protein [Candidatus Binatota bacterium]